MKSLNNLTGDILKRFKQLTVDVRNFKKLPIVKNLGLGVSAGTTDLSNYEKWSKFYETQEEKNHCLKNEVILKLFTNKINQLHNQCNDETKD